MEIMDKGLTISCCLKLSENTPNTSKFIQLICPFGPKVWDIVEKNALLCVRSPLLASKGSLRKLLCQFQVTAELLSHFFCWEAFCHIRCLPVCFICLKKINSKYQFATFGACQFAFGIFHK